MLVLVVVLALDRLGFSVETRREYSRAISFYQRDGEITRILELSVAAQRELRPTAVARVFGFGINAVCALIRAITS